MITVCCVGDNNSETLCLLKRFFRNSCLKIKTSYGKGAQLFYVYSLHKITAPLMLARDLVINKIHHKKRLPEKSIPDNLFLK